MHEFTKSFLLNPSYFKTVKLNDDQNDVIISFMRREPSFAQWRNKGGQGRTSAPGTSLWERQIEVEMLRTNYEMSNISGC